MGLLITFTQLWKKNKLIQLGFIIFWVWKYINKTKEILLPESVDVTTDRYEKIKMREDDSEVPTSGKVKLKPSGTWKYTVYEQTSNSNLSPVSESVVGVLETGILQVSNATEEVTYNFHTLKETNYIHIP